jgi:peptide/nickel transport system permease protein
LVHASRTDLKISLGATLIAAVIGVTAGLLTGYRGGATSTVALRLTDVMLAFPSILLALFLVAVIGPSDWIVILALTILYIPGFLRFARGMAISLRERAFVEASVISGARSWYVIRRHLLPNAIGPLLVGVALTAAYTLLAAATLAYLGLGTPPPAPSWGNMLKESFNYLFQEWRYGIWPGICIVVVALGYMLVSEGVERAVQRGAGADGDVDDRPALAAVRGEGAGA